MSPRIISRRAPEPFSPPLVLHTKQARHTQTHRICIATNISIMTWYNKHSQSPLMKQQCKERREAHPLVLGLIVPPPSATARLSVTLYLPRQGQKYQQVTVSGVNSPLVLARYWISAACQSDLIGDEGGGHGNWLLTHSVGGSFLQEGLMRDGKFRDFMLTQVINPIQCSKWLTH